jgi:hypothetical protein
MAIFLVAVGWLLAGLLLGLMLGPYLGWVSGHYPEVEQRSAGQIAPDSSSVDLVAALAAEGLSGVSRSATAPAEHLEVGAAVGRVAVDVMQLQRPDRAAAGAATAGFGDRPAT